MEIFRIPALAALCLLISLAALPACQTPGPAALSQEDIAANEATTKAWLEAARKGDWAAVAKTYTDDAVLMPPNGPAVTGRDEIQAAFEAFPPITAVEAEALEVEGCGDLVYVRGRYSLAMSPEGSDPIQDSGKYLEIRRKQADGSWLLSRDMFSSDLPPPAPVGEEQ